MLTGIQFDAVDVAALEAFWLSATRGKLGGLTLDFLQTDVPKSAKNRLHLCLAAGPDWSAEVRRLEELGAVRADIGQGDVPWDVLADPEGNEFCLLRPGHPGLLAEIGLAQICLDVASSDRAEQAAFWQATSTWRLVEHNSFVDRFRRTESDPISLVMGPPAAPKVGRNRVRLSVDDPTRSAGTYLDPGGNEFDVTA